MQIDPISDASNFLSTYAYAGNDPVLANDPNGLLSQNPTWMAGYLQLMSRNGQGGGGDDIEGDLDNAQFDDGGILQLYLASADIGDPGSSMDGYSVTQVFNANSSGQAGSPAAAYASLVQLVTGQPPSANDTYLIQLLYQQTWGSQASNIGASLSPAGALITGIATSDNQPFQIYVSASDIQNQIANLDLNPVPSESSEGGLQIAAKIYETTAISWETTEQGVKGAVSMSNKIAGTALEGVELGSKTLTVGMGLVSAAFTISDAVQNGWENHHTADLALTIVETGLGLFEASNPIGWGLAAGMFVGNLISEHYTGKSLTENLFDE